MKYFVLLHMLILASSCKKDRTAYLSDLQKEMLDSFKAGQVFYMLENQTDTLKFTVKTVGTSTASNGYFWENGGPQTWTESGKATFDCEKGPKKISADFIVIGGKGDYLEFLFSDYHITGILSSQYYIYDEIKILGVNYNDVHIFKNALYINNKNGILKYKENDYELLRLP